MTEPMTLGRALAGARKKLTEAGIGDAARDARLLVEAATGTGRLDAIARPDMPVDEAAAGRIEVCVGRRAAGEPVHRILGGRSFHGLDLALNADTLEPRDDSEALVGLALDLFRANPGGAATILDLGTGTGAIGLALLAEWPHARAHGVDIAKGAVEAAIANAANAGLAARFSASVSDWFAAVAGRYDLIVSNPPYIASGALGALDREVREHDPLRALDGGADGLDAYRIIAAGAAAHLAEGGVVAVETGFDQREAVTAIFTARGFDLRGSACDLGGRDRALAFRAANKPLGISGECV